MTKILALFIIFLKTKEGSNGLQESELKYRQLVGNGTAAISL